MKRKVDKIMPCKFSGEWDQRDVKKIRHSFNMNGTALTINEAINILENMRDTYGGYTQLMCESWPVKEFRVFPKAEETDDEIVDIVIDMRVPEGPGYDHETDSSIR